MLDYLLAERGRMARVAAAVGISPAYLSQIANGVRRVPTGKAAALEAACEGNVRRWEMFSADWHRIWPELINSEGAPTVTEDPPPPVPIDASSSAVTGRVGKGEAAVEAHDGA